MKIAFIIGSPRSGTTVLGNCLNCHTDIREWYEPYFIWAPHFDISLDDKWNDENLNDKSRYLIRKEYKNFFREMNGLYLVDKSPGYAQNVKCVYNIFPEAKWIHIFRDGRDVTLSIKKEWQKREKIVEQKRYLDIIKLGITMLWRQPFWRHRFKALLYEVMSVASTNPKLYLNKAKWRGSVGWGPRFSGWQEYLETHSSLEFNAMQWVKSVEAVHRTWPLLPEKNKIEVKYEDFISDGKKTLENILDFLSLKGYAEFYSSIPKLRSNNFNKWEREFSSEEIELIDPILTKWLKQFGYRT